MFLLFKGAQEVGFTNTSGTLCALVYKELNFPNFIFDYGEEGLIESLSPEPCSALDGYSSCWKGSLLDTGTWT